MAFERDLGLDLLQITESAAKAASVWMGRGDKEGADGAAVDSMRQMLRSAAMDGLVVIGEGEKHEVPMLYHGDRVGNGQLPLTDVAIDPVDGNTLVALGRGNSLSVIAVADRNSMFNPKPCVYMEKIAVGKQAADAIDINNSCVDNLMAVAEATGKSVREVTAVILDRDRNRELIEEVREAGARIRLIPDGDVTGAVSAAWPESGSDILFGIGGVPEGVIASAAFKCLGGTLQAKLWPRTVKERHALIEAGYDINRVYDQDSLIRSDHCVFVATGVTDGCILKGVRYDGTYYHTQSLIMRSHPNTVRVVNSRSARA